MSVRHPDRPDNRQEPVIPMRVYNRFYNGTLQRYTNYNVNTNKGKSYRWWIRYDTRTKRKVSQGVYNRFTTLPHELFHWWAVVRGIEGPNYDTDYIDVLLMTTVKTTSKALNKVLRHYRLSGGRYRRPFGKTQVILRRMLQPTFSVRLQWFSQGVADIDV